MQTKYWLYIVGAAAGAILILALFYSQSKPAFSGAQRTAFTNESVTLANQRQQDGNSTVASETNGLYMTIIDERSGRYAVVSSNKAVVLLKDSGGNYLVDKCY